MFDALFKRHLLCWLLGISILPLWADDQLQPADPGEFFADTRVSHTGLLLSENGRWLCFRSNSGYGVIDLHDGKIEGLGNINNRWQLMTNSTPNAAWSPVSSQLAFYVHREGRVSLDIWSADTKKHQTLMTLPRDLYMGGWRPPVWSADGKTLYIVVNQHLPWPKSHPDDDYPPTRSENATLKLTEHYSVTVRRPRFEKEYESAYAEKRRSLIMAVNVATGHTAMLAKGNDIAALYPSPDNKQLIALQTKTNVPGRDSKWTQQVLADLYRVEIADIAGLPTMDLDKLDDRRAGWFDYRNRQLKPVLTDIHLNKPDTSLFIEVREFGAEANAQLSWSPDSRRFAYATVGRQAKGDIFVYDLESAELRNLTAGIELPESPKSLGYGDHYTWQFNSLKFGSLYPPLWLPDGQSLVAIGRGEVWNISLDRDQKPRLLTVDLPQEVRRIIPAYDQRTALQDEHGQLMLIAKERTSRLDSVWKLDVSTTRTKKLTDTGVWVNEVALVDGSEKHLVYTGQGPTVPRNIYRVAGAGKPEMVTKFQLPLTERRYPESRVLTWRTEVGEEARGLLYLPDGASKTNKVPMIVDGYPGRIDAKLDERAKKGIVFFNEALHGLLQEGFAVLYPDIEMSDEGVYQRPMFQIVEAVQAATDAALATGVIDAQRLGIMGQSYGGYMTQAVIAQTDRFKAAVSRAGLSDLYGDYAAGGSSSLKWSEIGQGRLEVPPWEDPQRYIENSPHTYFNKVKTPLLLVHGKGDGTVPVEFSRQSFRALERLKNPTVFAQYRRLGHNATQEVHRRVRLWFRQHLLGGENVAGLAEQGSFFLGGDLKQDKLLTE